MADKDKDKGEQLFGEGLPGTGGDFIDPGDVEGHRRRLPAIPDDDGTPDIISTVRNIPDVPGDDVEGHLYTGGPTTQGEFARRAPGDNPHGDR